MAKEKKLVRRAWSKEDVGTLKTMANGVCKRKACDVLLKPTSEDIQPVARKEDRALSRDLLKEMPW